MAKRRKFAAQENAGFGGMDLSGNPQRLAGHIAQFDKNGDHRWPLTWAPRPGLARGALAQLSGIVRNIKWFRGRDGIDHVFYTLNTGTLEGTALPAPDWNPMPVIRGGPGAEFANPVTALAVSDAFGLTLTWTNPTSAFWRGTKVLRRTDGIYPQGPNDPAATTVYDGRLATATDSGLTAGTTGYYSAYAYTRNLWAEPDKVSGTKLAAISSRVLALTASALYLSTNNGVTWSTVGTGLPATLLVKVLVAGNRVYVTRNNLSGTEVYRSIDGGINFTQVTKPTTVGSTAHQFIVGASNRLVLSHATTGDAGWVVAYSDDFGATWTDSAVISPNRAILGLAFVSGTTLAVTCSGAAAGNPFTTHVSSNNGATWGASVGGDAWSSDAYLAICANGNFIVSSNGGANTKKYLSINSGATWTDKGFLNSFEQPVFAYGTEVIIVDPTSTSYYRSSDSGVTWGVTALATFLTTAKYCNSAWYAGYQAVMYRGTTVTSLVAVTALLAGDVISVDGVT